MPPRAKVLWGPELIMSPNKVKAAQSATLILLGGNGRAGSHFSGSAAAEPAELAGGEAGLGVSAAKWGVKVGRGVEVDVVGGCCEIGVGFGALGLG